jgi:hypothetical protein
MDLALKEITLFDDENYVSDMQGCSGSRSFTKVNNSTVELETLDPDDPDESHLRKTRRS